MPLNFFLISIVMARRYTQEEFLEKVKSLNRNDIDYSKFIYLGNNKKGKCKCNVCGHEWECVPMSLFNGHGCPRCAVEHKARKLSKSNDMVISQFKEVNGDKYDYSKVDYKNDRTCVEIICKTHGSFWQKPCLHLRGHGCPRCADNGVKLSKEEFINKIGKINKNIDLSEFVYVNASTKGKCKCNVCGHEWYGSYNALKRSHFGCPSCASKSRVEKRKNNLDAFIVKLRERRGDIDYDFSKSLYVNSLIKMDVICKEHGLFKIRPNDLMSGHGCPMCNESRLEREVRNALIKGNIEFVQGNHYKWLLNEETNHPLSLDFFIPSKNIAIECQGVQHFEVIDHFNGREGFNVRKNMDELKKRLCNESNVKLIYYLEERYNKYMKEDDIYFNDTVSLMEYVRKY